MPPHLRQYSLVGSISAPQLLHLEGYTPRKRAYVGSLLFVVDALIAMKIIATATAFAASTNANGSQSEEGITIGGGGGGGGIPVVVVVIIGGGGGGGGVVSPTETSS